MPSPLISKLCLAATVLMVAILASSAYLRLSATQACPPGSECATLAEAQETPDIARKIARVAHRLSASAVAVVVLLVAALAWLRREGRRETRWVALLLIALTAFLASLGAIVGSSYSPAVTLGNLLAGNTMAAAAWWLHLRNRAAPPPAVGTMQLAAACAGAALVVAVALLAPSALPLATSFSIGVGLAQNLAVTFAALACAWLAWRATSMRR